jgi:Tat protein secretion system quality control protein TatD with DNase activity
MRHIFYFVLLAGCLLTLPSRADDIPMIDAHSQLPTPGLTNDVIHIMNEAGICHVILSFRGSAKRDDVADLASTHPGRITGALKIKGKHWPTGHKKFFKGVAKQLKTGSFNAIGEALLYHAAKGNKAPEYVVTDEKKQFRHVLEIAREKSWPLILHIEFRASPDPTSFMEMLERILANNRDMSFPLIHLAQLDPDEAERLISRHPNVYLMTSHSNTVTARKTTQPWTNMFEGDTLKAGWRSVMTRHPDRFVLNFDNVWPDHWGPYYVEQAELWRKTLSTFLPAAAHKIAHENAEKLWNLTPRCVQ